MDSQLAQAGAGIGGMGFWHYLLAVALFVVCFLLIVIILLQKGRGGGLSAALGGAGGNTAFGAKTGDVFTWITVAFASLFLLLAVIGNYIFVQTGATAATPAVTPVPGAVPGGADADAPEGPGVDDTVDLETFVPEDVEQPGTEEGALPADAGAEDAEPAPAEESEGADSGDQPPATEESSEQEGTSEP